VLPTDTIYGLVASALGREAVERVYKLKGRRFNKPCIILISEPNELIQFGIKKADLKRINNYWPGPVSLVFAIAGETTKKFQYLHRGADSLAFRQPNHPGLIEFLKTSGPLIAPSANPEGGLPSKTITEAKNYFGNNVDFYVDGGTLENEPSKLISLISKNPQILRG